MRRGGAPLVSLPQRRPTRVRASLFYSDLDRPLASLVSSRNNRIVIGCDREEYVAKRGLPATGGLREPGKLKAGASAAAEWPREPRTERTSTEGQVGSAGLGAVT